jgi:uncharacterized protein (UPF0548 family)
MPKRPRFSRRLATAAVWPAGIALTSWNYMWRTTPMHRREEGGTVELDGPPPLPDSVAQAELQLPEDGVGPLFHRRYQIRIREARLSAEPLLASIRANPNVVAPTEFARFIKVHGDREEMRVGDEYVVRMPGPWDGPVRVVEVKPCSFRLATLCGHLEAGQIEFTASDEEELVVAIESWARSADRLSDLLYQRLRMAKEIQLHMWTSFLEQVTALAGGRMSGGIEIVTRRVDEAAPRMGSRLGDARAKRALDALHDKPPNFDAGSTAEKDGANGWRIDDYRQPLPREPPGPPVPGGSWEAARRAMRDYEFADPRIVRAIYYEDRPLEERDMLLELRFHGLRFHAGVRIAGTRDETTAVGGRTVRIWGWNYRTLQGHLEMGQMDYEVWKWVDSGTVEFRIHAVSKAATIPNPIIRLGFRLVGRREQRRFARHACRRMAELVEAELTTRRSLLSREGGLRIEKSGPLWTQPDKRGNTTR